MKTTFITVICALLPGVLTGCSFNNSNPPSLQPVAAALPARSTPTPGSQIDPKVAADKAWKTANHANTEEAYNHFAAEHPKDARAEKARARAVQLAWAHSQRAATSDAYEAFATRYPNSPHTAEANKLAQGETISLTEAVSRGWVTAHVNGDGLQSVSLTLSRNVRRPMRVSIPAGTLFDSGGSAQNMVATDDSTADLTESNSSDLSVSAACANFYLDQPDENNRFSVKKAHPNASLRKVLAVVASQHPRSIVAQLAVWSITDDPSREDVGGHLNRSPENDDYVEASRLLKEAGINPSSRRMFQHLK